MVGGEMMWQTHCWRVWSYASSYLLICEFFNSHGCRDTESWVVLLDFNCLPHEALQLGLISCHLEHEMALVCCDYSHKWWRYCACNTVVSSSCHVFFIVVWLLMHFMWCQWHCRHIISYIRMILALLQGVVVFYEKLMCEWHVKSYGQ